MIIFENAKDHNVKAMFNLLHSAHFDEQAYVAAKGYVELMGIFIFFLL